MNAAARYLSAAEAAARLGVSAKALRLYERQGLLSPLRTAAGWRAYGPLQMARAGEIASLRALGFTLAEVAQVLKGSAETLEQALETHEAALEGRLRELAGMVERVQGVRSGLVQGSAPVVAFELPWPWGGERFELGEVRPLNYIIGSMGSGKTRLALRLAETLAGAAFLGLDRLEDDGAAARARLAADPALKARAQDVLDRLVRDGAAPSGALMALIAALEAEGPKALVVDMIEEGLDQASQQAVIAHLRRRGPGARPLFILTRSSAILDLAAVGPDEAIILCPANHSPPCRVAPRPGAPGYEAVATCLATPEVRARVARRPAAA